MLYKNSCDVHWHIGIVYLFCDNFINEATNLLHNFLFTI